VGYIISIVGVFHIHLFLIVVIVRVVLVLIILQIRKGIFIIIKVKTI
jgi:hypothetical protein